jgi:hypothetical protein
MTRKDIGTQWDRDNRNAINDNFKDLFDMYRRSGLELNEAIEKAEQATVDALLAKEVAGSTREEMLAIIREQTQNGDLAPEIAQARGGHETVGERFNSVDSQLSRNTNESRQRDFFSFNERGTADIFSNFYSVLSDRSFLFDIGVGEDEFIQMEFRKETHDDFIKFRNVHLNHIKPETINENYLLENVENGNIADLSERNQHTTDVGMTITHEFEGTAIYFQYYMDTRGGMWRAEVDGEFVKNITTHVDGIPAEDFHIVNGIRYGARTLIADNLPLEKHTLVLTFIGEDPDHVPTSTPRGWIKISDDNFGNERDMYTFIIESVQMGSTKMMYDSNKEFAFRAKPVGAPYEDEWFPFHNGIGTAFVGESGFQKVFVDGKEISMSDTVSSSPFKEIKMIQKLEFFHPEETQKLGVLTLTATINHRGVSFSSKMSWSMDVVISSGYVNMFTISPQFASLLVSTYGNEYDLTIFDNSIEDISEPAPYGFVALNPEEHPDYFMYIQNFLARQTLRLEHSSRRGEPDGTNLYMLQHRNEDLQKLYPYTYNDHTATAGEVYHFEGHYGFGKHPSAAVLLRY